MLRSIFGCFLLLVVLSSFGQLPSNLVWKNLYSQNDGTIYNSYQEFTGKIHPLSNGFFLVTGSTVEYRAGQDGHWRMMTYLDALGNRISKDYLTYNRDYVSFPDVTNYISNGHNGYFTVTTRSNEPQNPDFEIRFQDAVTHEEKFKHYLGSGSPELYTRVCTSGDNLILTGTTLTDSADGDIANAYLGADIFISSISPNGDPQWKLTLGGNDADSPLAVATAQNGNHILFFKSTSTDHDLAPWADANCRYYMAEISQDGILDTIFPFTYQQMGANFSSISHEPLSNGNILFYGTARWNQGVGSKPEWSKGSDDMLLFEYNPSTSAIVKTNVLGGVSSDRITRIRQDVDSNLVILMDHKSDNLFMDGYNGEPYSRWLFKLSPELTYLDHYVTLNPTSRIGNDCDDPFDCLRISDFAILNDGSYVFVASLYDADVHNTIFKLSGFPELDQTNSVSEQKNTGGLLVYPNPTSGKIYIDTDKALHNISVLDNTGRTILNIQDLPNDGAIDLSNLKNGTYILKAITPSIHPRIVHIVLE